MKTIYNTDGLDKSKEIFEELLCKEGFLLERIITNGQCTPLGEWLEQERAEFVLLLKGSASLRFEKENELIRMLAGDFLIIPPNTKHRVEEVSQEETIWLALHFDDKDQG